MIPSNRYHLPTPWRTHRNKSKANLDDKILFGKITHRLDPEIRKMLVKGIFGNADSTLQFGP